MSFFKKWKQGNLKSKKTSGNLSGNTAGGSPDYIICGLGNPGARYENTRHNCGYMAVDLLSEQEGFKVKKLKFKSLTALEVINGVKCLVMKPVTYMNLSGEALTAAMDFYKLPPEHVIVIFDDFSLPHGTLKIRKSGSDGGHNGMKNIILQSDSDNFPRVKIGIGQPPHQDYPVKEWVLSSFRKDESKVLEDSLERAVQAIRLMIKGDVVKAMNDFNGKA
ncbi:MAG: aminoacyl-tRNA hydrolase [Oscillospiraceae bacterium]|jgi:PTH1 family peptidyl-tRNA hydrolase|nr:aminoacyl-tRNA hydrolase [Oscillospiraceae bacterium]